MSFASLAFLQFCAVVLLVYYLLPHRWQRYWLLLASAAFYAKGGLPGLGLLLAATMLVYLCGLRLAEAGPERGRGWLVAGVSGSLVLLGWFKYAGFAADTVTGLLQSFGMMATPVTIKLMLPLGISFYTFRFVSYLMDISRGKLEPERDLVTFATYVAFFPLVVAGPIERAGVMLPQLHEPRAVTSRDLAWGALLILIGLTRKLAIADPLAQGLASAYIDPGSRTSLQLVTSLLMQALQIYQDFAGYSDMAIGVALLFGIRIRVNFNHPYVSRNLQEFWHRWHISLSTWLRDYLYIPLGGSRVATWKIYRNLMITMVLGGLWHGAAWTFVAWGALHGVGLAAHRWYAKRLGDWKPAQPVVEKLLLVVSWLVTMTVVGVGWILFCAPSFQVAAEFLLGIVRWHGVFDVWVFFPVLPALFLTFAIDLPQHRADDHAVFLSWPWFWRGVIYAMLILSCVVLRVDGNAPFVYAQF